MASIQPILQKLQAAAQAEASGDSTAHTTLLNEISNLRNAAETPADRLMRLRFHCLENLCARMAIELGVLQAIVARKGESITAAELAKHTGADELFIIRTMRLVTHACIAEETGHATYASNATTELITTKGGIGGEKHHTDLGFPVGSRLIEMHRKGVLHQFPDEPGQKTPFEYTFGHPIFEYFQHDAEQKEAFDDYMAIRRDVNAPQWFENYPAREELSKGGLRKDEDAVLVVDVGGGFGHEISKFGEKHRDLPGRLILQDLPETFKNTAGPEGIEVMQHDFFKEQPIKGARIYYLRQILHDWSPKNCSKILTHIVKAMDPAYSRLLIDDYVLPDTGADRRASALDFLMFMFAGGMERTAGQFETLLDGVGLEIVKIWKAKTDLECVIEAKVKGS